MDYFEVIGLIFILLMFILANLPKRKKAPLEQNMNRPNEEPKPLAPLKPASQREFESSISQRDIQLSSMKPVSQRKFESRISQRHRQTQIVSSYYDQPMQKKIRKKSPLHALLKDKRKLILSHEILKRPYE